MKYKVGTKFLIPKLSLIQYGKKEIMFFYFCSHKQNIQVLNWNNHFKVTIKDEELYRFVYSTFFNKFWVTENKVFKLAIIF